MEEGVMGVRLDKTAIVSLYYYCRQAERSLDRVLGIPWNFANDDNVCKRDSETLWQGFREYYDPQQRERIQAQVNLLTSLGGRSRKSADPCIDSARIRFLSLFF